MITSHYLIPINKQVLNYHTLTGYNMTQINKEKNKFFFLKDE